MSPRRIPADFLLEGASEIVTCRDPAPKRGAQMRDLGIVPGGALAAHRGVLCYVGSGAGIRDAVELQSGARVLRAEGRTVLPGFVDPHTHLPFAGHRAAEFHRRLEGAEYAEILKAGGGIHETVEATRRAGREEIAEWSRARLDRMLRHGTTACEAKSGYGLDPDQEVKQLEAVRDLRDRHVVEVAPTFLGAHVVPREYSDRRTAYVDLVIGEMIPRVADSRLAEFCDVFCAEGAFTNQEAERILATARDRGLGLKVHADQLAAGGATEMAADLGAVSADHLEHVSAQGIGRLADSGTVAVLLPGACFSLRAPYPPARRLIDAGAAVALATDCNPGTSCTESMQEILTLACVQMRMTLAEAITAATINAACAIRRETRCGSLEVGKEANFVVLDLPDHRHLAYHFGVNHVHTVVVRGKVVVSDGGRMIDSLPSNSATSSSS